MTRALTDRMVVGLVLGVLGALVAIIGGLPEVALVVAPWIVLLTLGLGHSARPRVTVLATVDQDRIIVGDSVELHRHVSADHKALVSVQTRPPVTFGVSQDSLPAMIEALHPGVAADVVMPLACDEWGAHDLGAATVRVLMPYGLFEWAGSTDGHTTVRVHPTSDQIQQLLTPWLVRRVSGTHTSRESARGVEYADLRQFGAGDSVRDINWRATARSERLWVSQRHPDRATDVVLLLDSFVETGHDARTVVGLGIEAAVALAETHLAATDRVGLIEFGGLIRWINPGTGRVQLQKLTDALLATRLYKNAADKELPLLSPQALPPRSFLVALTPLLDQRFIDAVFLARARGHDVAVVECEVDPYVADEPRQSASIARRIWLAERAVLRDRMAEQGIAVATWSPGRDLDVVLGELIRFRRRLSGAAR